MDERTIAVGRRFRGPDVGGGTGNGGYVCGLVALAAGPGSRAVEIRRAAGVPLDRPLVVRVEKGEAVLSDDEGPIARTTSADLAVTEPMPPPLDVARRVSALLPEEAREWGAHATRFRSVLCAGIGGRLVMDCASSRGRWTGPTRRCAGRAGGGVAAGWRRFSMRRGRLRAEFVWSALDCPGGWAIAGPGQYRDAAGGDPRAGGWAAGADRDGLACGGRRPLGREPPALRGDGRVRRARTPAGAGRGHLGGPA